MAKKRQMESTDCFPSSVKVTTGTVAIDSLRLFNYLSIYSFDYKRPFRVVSGLRAAEGIPHPVMER